MRLLRCPFLRFAALIAAVSVAATSCASDDDDIQSASNQMKSDAISIAEAVSEVAEAGEVIHLSACRNDGSGPVPPGTLIYLSLRDGATVGEALGAVEAAVGDLGYETDPGSGNVLLVARRDLDDRWGGEIRLHESGFTNSELTLRTSLTPTITC